MWEKKIILNDIIRSGKSLLSLINSILELSDIEKPLSKNNLQIFNIKKMIKQVIDLLNCEIKRKESVLVLVAQSHEPWGGEPWKCLPLFLRCYC